MHRDIGEVFIFGNVCLEPVLIAENLFNVSCVMYFDEVTCLGDINTIKAIDDSQRLNLDGEFRVDGGDDGFGNEF